MTLRRHRAAGTAPDAGRLHADVARVVDAPWRLALTADCAFPRVAGRHPAGTRLAVGYVGRLHAAAAHDARLAEAFVRVSGLVDPPAALLRPGVVLRVLRHRPDRHAVAVGAGRPSGPTSVG